MERMLSKVVSFIREDSGVTAIEYALIASLIAVLIVGSVTTIGQTLLNTFRTVAESLLI